MKNLLLLLASTVVLFSSCTKKTTTPTTPTTPDNATLILGTWKNTSVTMYYTPTSGGAEQSYNETSAIGGGQRFNADKTAQAINLSTNQVLESYTYTLSGNNLTLTSGSESFSYTIKTLNATDLTWRYEGNGTPMIINNNVVGIINYVIVSFKKV